MNQVFLSYARLDEAYVAELYTAITDHGISAWRDSEIRYSDEWESVIEAQLDTCAAVVVVMSEASAKSHWVRSELLRALRRKTPVFPVWLNGDVFLALEATQLVDVRDRRLPPSSFYQHLKGIVDTDQPQTQSSGPTISLGATDNSATLSNRISSLLPALRFAGWTGKYVSYWWNDLAGSDSGGGSISKMNYVPRYYASVHWAQPLNEPQSPPHETMDRLGWKRNESMSSTGDDHLWHAYYLQGIDYFGMLLGGVRSGSRVAVSVADLLSEAFKLDSSNVNVSVGKLK